MELVLLDRDGVLNRNVDEGVRRVEDWVWLPGSIAAMRMLAESGRRLMVVTNQANIGRGLLSIPQLDEIHRGMVRILGPACLRLRDVLYCPHRPDESCECRKPQPGLIVKALRTAGVEPERALVVGDRVSDVIAASRAGCWSLHVRSGHLSGGTVGPSVRWPAHLGSVRSLLAAAHLLVG